MTDYYNILGINKSASSDEIKQAYRKLASQHHPDRGGDTAKFQEIQGAYATLSDPEKRAQYDNPPPSGFNFGNHGSPQDMQDIFSQFGMNFGDFFAGGGPRHAQRARNRTLGIQTQISLEDAFFGKEMVANIKLPSGKDQTLEIKIPAGVRDGTTLRLAGMGDDSISGIPQGDIHLTISIMPHSVFRRNGDDLIMALSITCFDAILGKTVQFNTIENKTVELNVPAGIQPGQLISVQGHGMPNMGNTVMRGRLMVEVAISIPSTLTDKQKDELRKIIE